MFRSPRSGVPLLALLAACAPSGTTVNPTPTPVAARADTAVPGAIRWVQHSAEHRALYLQVYRNATAAIEHSADTVSGAWGVVLDADETVIDNSAFELQQAVSHQPYSEDAWAVWVRKRAATALPGAVGFINRAHALGGRVIIVTNRADSLCADTQANLVSAGIRADAVLCKAVGESGKQRRFDAVLQGTAGLPPLQVLAWVGDNIQDFPHLSQAISQQPDSAFGNFGHTYFMLPNPMYGSWQ
ncbi:MAG TPA: HAD family acid phosphatase [Gemmatimonadales bacterium]|nr:HAD family acid phosphatase [Gemmatimonadales bacterium]